MRSFSAGWLLDGKGGPAARHALLEIAGRQIRSIRWGCTEKELSCADVDFSSCTLLPVLCDGHVHLSLSGIDEAGARRRQLSASFAEARETIQNNLAAHLACGIVAVRDGGDRQSHVLHFKRSELPLEAPVQVRSAGQAWHAPGRYGAMIGRTPLQGRTLAESIRDSEPGDLIKIVNSGPNSLSVFGRETSPQFALEHLREAVAFGHSSGLRVMAHANGRRPVQEALEAGCDSIEHGYFMGRENLGHIAERGVTWIPTVYAMESLCNARRGTPEGETAARNVDHQLEQIRMAREYGVVVALGTDAGSLGVNHGEALIEELRLFMSAGMSVEEAVQCATSSAFCLLGIQGMGSLRPGKRAAFVAVHGGPERLPQSLRAPAGVFVDGYPAPLSLIDPILHPPAKACE